MPSYVVAAFASAVAGLLLAMVVPSPRLPTARATRRCAWLFGTGVLLFVTSVSMTAVAMLTSVPSLIVVLPAAAAVGVALTLWLMMRWFARTPDAEPEATGESTDGTDEDGGGGGGGGLRPTEDPPRAPGPDGINWDDFDRDRDVWESLRELVGEREFS